MISTLAAVALLLAGSVSGCGDSGSWKDQKGYKCSGWSGYNCFTAHRKYSYSLSNQEALLKNCKKTCGTCNYFNGACQDNMRYEDEKGYTCGEWKGHNCYDATAKHGYSVNGEFNVKMQCQYTCKNCGYQKCYDEINFYDQKGYRCGDWVGYNCKEAKSKHGYSESGQREVMKACPHSCKICNERVAPTLKPTAPTARPTTPPTVRKFCDKIVLRDFKLSAPEETYTEGGSVSHEQEIDNCGGQENLQQTLWFKAGSTDTDTSVTSLDETLGETFSTTLGGEAEIKVAGAYGVATAEASVTVKGSVTDTETSSMKEGETTISQTKKYSELRTWHLVKAGPGQLVKASTEFRFVNYDAKFTGQAECWNRDGVKLETKTVSGSFKGRSYTSFGSVKISTERCPSKCNDRKLKSGAAWHDIHGPEFDCSWYGQSKKRCRKYQKKTKNEYKAKKACCVCGGGVQL